MQNGLKKFSCLHIRIIWNRRGISGPKLLDKNLLELYGSPWRDKTKQIRWEHTKSITKHSCILILPAKLLIDRRGGKKKPTTNTVAFTWGKGLTFRPLDEEWYRILKPLTTPVLLDIILTSNNTSQESESSRPLKWWFKIKKINYRPETDKFHLVTTIIHRFDFSSPGESLVAKQFTTKTFQVREKACPASLGTSKITVKLLSQLIVHEKLPNSFYSLQRNISWNRGYLTKLLSLPCSRQPSIFYI